MGRGARRQPVGSLPGADRRHTELTLTNPRTLEGRHADRPRNRWRGTPGARYAEPPSSRGRPSSRHRTGGTGSIAGPEYVLQFTGSLRLVERAIGLPHELLHPLRRFLEIGDASARPNLRA